MASQPVRHTSAQGLVEYVLGLALVAIICVVVLLTVGQSISNTFSNLTVTLGVAQPAASPSPSLNSCQQHSQQPQNCNTH